MLVALEKSMLGTSFTFQRRRYLFDPEDQTFHKVRCKTDYPLSFFGRWTGFSSTSQVSDAQVRRAGRSAKAEARRCREKMTVCVLPIGAVREEQVRDRSAGVWGAVQAAAAVALHHLPAFLRDSVVPGLVLAVLGLHALHDLLL
jgi:hypothetical protein